MIFNLLIWLQWKMAPGGFKYADFARFFIAGFISILALIPSVDARNVSTSASKSEKAAEYLSAVTPVQTLSSSSASNLILNEIMASNATTVEDEDGDAGDWIEIYNSSSHFVQLNGYGLSDDYNEPFKWVFPDVMLEPGEFLLVWATGKNRRDPESEMHTNFSIAEAGEEVILTDYNGTRLDELPPTEIPTDISIGRKPDEFDTWYFFDEPTPGAANTTTGHNGILDNPSFTEPPGFYTDKFELVMEHPDPDAAIHFTLDGSEPTADSPVYTGSLSIRDRSDEPNELSAIPSSSNTYWSEPEEPVKKSTVIRAKAVRPGFISSRVKTGTYFIDPLGAQRYSLPVVSLATDRDHFFCDDTGIYVEGNSRNANFREPGREWERQLHLELFDETGDKLLNQSAGVRIHGGATRIYGQKSLRLYARNEYGDNRFYHRIFPDQPYTEYNRLLLRNSGNDWQSTMFRDALAQRLIHSLNVDTQAYRPTVVFLNGEYWGIHNFRERYDRHYLERVYRIDPENIDLLTKRDEVKEGDNAHYKQMIDFMERHDLGEESHFKRIREMMDLDNFLDYYSAQIYFGNRDWPHNNIDFWRFRVPYDSTALPGHDGRWRWLLFDVDYALGLHTSYEFDTIDRLLSNDGWSTTILRNLLDNEHFKIQFINRIADHLNSVFLPGRVMHYIDRLSSVVMPEMPEHIARWGRHESMEEWEEKVHGMKTFADHRPDALRQHLMTQFGLEYMVHIKVDTPDPSAGQARVNSILIHSDTPGIEEQLWPWSGSYFKEVPVTLEAEASPGYVFSHWEFPDQNFESPGLTHKFNDQKEDSVIVRVFFKKASETDVENSEQAVNKFRLKQNYPNPFNPETVISFELPVDGAVVLEVYDILGRRVAVLVNETMPAGIHQTTWDASDAASGAYIYRISAGDFVQSQSMILVK